MTSHIIYLAAKPKAISAKTSTQSCASTRPAADMILAVEFRIVPDAIHFSFLAQCKPKGAAFLEREGEPYPLCEDVRDRACAEIHDELQTMIVDYFNGAINPVSADVALASTEKWQH